MFTFILLLGALVFVKRVCLELENTALYATGVPALSWLFFYIRSGIYFDLDGVIHLLMSPFPDV